MLSIINKKFIKISFIANKHNLILPPIEPQTKSPQQIVHNRIPLYNNNINRIIFLLLLNS